MRVLEIYFIFLFLKERHRDLQFKTIGKEFFPEAVIELKVYTDLDFIPSIPFESTFQIIIIEEGTGIIKVNQKKIMIHSPIVYCINELETVSIEKGQNLKIHIIYFHPQIIDINFSFKFIRQALREDVTSAQVQDLYWLNSFLVRDENSDIYCQLTQVTLRRLLYLFDCIMDEFDNQRTYFWICRGRSFFLEILCYLSNLYTSVPLSMVVTTIDSQSEFLEDILLYIHTNYAEKISLQHLVNIFNLNRTTLNKLFKKSTGDTVISYLIKLRIELSASMLRDTGIPIKEIGFRVGFDDTVNFGRTFKKLKGCSPKQYREENNWLSQFS